MNPLLRLAAASALLLLAMALADGGDLFHMATFQLHRTDTARPLFNAVAFAGVYCFGVLGVAALCIHRSRAIRWAALGLVAATTAVELALRFVNGEGFTHHDAALLWSETAFLGDALRFFLPAYLPAIGLVAVGGAALVLAFRRLGGLRSLAWLALAPLAFLAASELTDQTFGKVYHFAPPYRVPILLRWAAAHRLPLYGERETPVLVPTAPALADHIVLIVDESINGHWLGVNGGRTNTTPFLSSGPAGLFNYGIASSPSNLSSTSNLLFQTGLQPAELPDRELRALRVPNLFSYMARAGLRTALVDAQSYSDRPPNLMTGYDLGALDRWVRLRELHPGLPEHQVDLRIVPALLEQLASGKPSFSYVIKTGAHLPYGDKAPPDARPFQPAAEGWAVRDDPALVRNAYLNALRFGVDHFLAELARALEASGESVLVLYTADHGQYLPSVPERRATPHATVAEPPADQAAVPLLVLAYGPARDAMAERYAPSLVDRVSGFEVFPTLLEMAGYDPQQLPGMGPSLFDVAAPREPRVFVSGNVFAAPGGFYVLNPSLGSACFLNPFTLGSLEALP